MVCLHDRQSPPRSLETQSGGWLWQCLVPVYQFIPDMIASESSEEAGEWIDRKRGECLISRAIVFLVFCG